MSYPSTLDSFTRATTTATVVASFINELQIALEQLQSKIGVDDSTDTISLDYLVKNVNSVNPGHGHQKQKYSSDISGTWSWEGVYSGFDVNEDMTRGDIVSVNSAGKLVLADADNDSRMPAIGMFLEYNISAGATDKKVLLKGSIKGSGWNFTSIGSPLYVQTTPGDMTVTQPNSPGDKVQRIGRVASANIVEIDPSYFIVEIV